MEELGERRVKGGRCGNGKVQNEENNRKQEKEERSWRNDIITLCEWHLGGGK